MTIFSRIARIIRANLNFNRPDTYDDNRNEDEAYRKKYARSNREQSRTGNADSNARHDPELARLYANLEVPYGSELATVTRSWKQLLRQYHPDMHSGDPEKQQIANQLVQELNRSYQELKKRLTQ